MSSQGDFGSPETDLKVYSNHYRSGGAAFFTMYILRSPSGFGPNILDACSLKLSL